MVSKSREIDRFLGIPQVLSNMVPRSNRDWSPSQHPVQTTPNYLASIRRTSWRYYLRVVEGANVSQDEDPAGGATDQPHGLQTGGSCSDETGGGGNDARIYILSTV